MHLFWRSSSRRRSSEASLGEISASQSYEEPRASSVRGAEAKSCRWPCNEFMLGAGIKKEFDQYIHNAELSAFIADKPPQHYYLTHSFTQNFDYHSRTSRVLFHLYDK